MKRHTRTMRNSCPYTKRAPSRSPGTTDGRYRYLFKYKLPGDTRGDPFTRQAVTADTLRDAMAELPREAHSVTYKRADR